MNLIIIDLKSRAPIYEQIINSVKEQIMKGFLVPDEALPSVRSLASELAINPNTIQKAYTELDRQGITYSVPGKGCFVASDREKIAEQFEAEYRKKLSALLSDGKNLGICKRAVTNLIDEIWGDTID